MLLAAVCGQLWAAQCAISISTPPQHWAGADVVWCWWKDGTFWLFITRLVVWNEPMSERVFWQWHVSSMMEAGKGNYRQGILTQVEWLVIFYHRLRVFPCDIHFCMKIEKTCWKEAFDITQMPSDIRRLTSALVSNPLDDLCIDIWMFVMIISEPRLQRDRIYPLYTEMYYIRPLLILQSAVFVASSGRRADATLAHIDLEIKTFSFILSLCLCLWFLVEKTLDVYSCLMHLHFALSHAFDQSSSFLW